MRTLWNIVSFMAVVHILALLIFVGWLWHSGRLSGDRIEAARALFAQTMEAEADAVAAREAAEADAEQDAIDAARQADPPLPSDRRIRQARLLQEEEAAVLRRIQDETDRRASELEAAFARLAQERDELEAQRRAWEAATGDQRAEILDAQFRKTVKLYETSPPKNVKQWIEELVRNGETERAVTYLDAMSPRAAKKVLTLFKTEQEARLATELLERIRTLGVPEGVEDSGDVDQPAEPTDASAAS